MKLRFWLFRDGLISCGFIFFDLVLALGIFDLFFQ